MPKQAAEQLNPLEMSDEDISNLDPSSLGSDQEDAGTPQDDDDQVSETREPEEPSEADEQPESEPDEEPEEEPEEPASRQDIFEQEEPSEPEPESEDKGEVDYKAVYDEIFAPFKASGREITVKSVEDIRQLMQMGVDYNKKMVALKPNLRILRTLESNGLLDVEKVNFMIDLVGKKRPEAIVQFLKDSEIDPMELDLSEDRAYTPNDHMVSQKEVDLNEVLDEIRGTETFERTIDELGNKWDEASRKIVAEQPALIKVINAHVAAGIYDQIMGIVESERLLGRLNGLSDLEAYKQVGDAIQARGGFNAPTKPEPKQSGKPRDPKLSARKRAASPTKGSPAKPTSSDFNPLAMSDEEFEKMSGRQFG